MKSLGVITLALMITGTAHADVPPEQKAEVAHLLHFVKNSSCTINRNGKKHQGEEAAGHILKKYDYFRDKIENTEQFIEYSATKSTMSGQYYTVLCGDRKPIKTKDWLVQELKAYRRKQENDPVQQGSESDRGQKQLR